MDSKVKNLSTQHSSLFQSINNYMNKLEELKIYIYKERLDMSVQTENLFEIPLKADNITSEDSLTDQSQISLRSSSVHK